VPTWVWILIAAAAVLVVAVIAGTITKQRKTKQLQDQFGPEYDRTVETADSKKAAEAELAARKERREQLQVRPLSTTARDRYTFQWRTVQAQFVDSPGAAVTSGDELIQAVMADRGYPVEDFESRAAEADRLVADLMQGLAAGFSEERERLEHQWDSGDDVSTEDLRVALTRYRSFFGRLLSA
jgi:hypothetical protein